MSAAPPPNWYPDPNDQAQLRWWDGSKWTEHLHAVVAESAVADSTTTTPSTRQQPAAVEQPAASVPYAAADQWATAQAPEQDGLQQFLSLQDFGVAPPPSRRPWIIGAVVILALIGVIAFVLTRGGDDAGDTVSQTPSTSASAATSVSPSTVSTTTTRPPGTTATATTGTTATTTTTAASALAGSTFTDPTNVYRLRVAPGWQDATVVGGLQTWGTGTSSNVFRDSVNVLIEKLPSDISIDDYLAASVRNAPKSLPSFVEIGRSVNNVNGKMLGQLDFRSNQNIPLRHRAIVLIKGRNAIVVTYTTEPARFDAESVKVQPYLTSVEGV